MEDKRITKIIAFLFFFMVFHGYSKFFKRWWKTSPDYTLAITPPFSITQAIAQGGLNPFSDKLHNRLLLWYKQGAQEWLNTMNQMTTLHICVSEWCCRLSQTQVQQAMVKMHWWTAISNVPVLFFSYRANAMSIPGHERISNRNRHRDN